MKNNKGYTLTELIVVMAIFIIVIMITTSAFDRIVSSGSKHAKSATSEIEGVVGLEMMRTDLSHAGYGLPWSFQPTGTPGYTENSSLAVTGNGIDAAALSDNPATATPPKLPRAIVAAPSTSGTNPGSDYLVIKSALLNPANTSTGRWGYLNYSTVTTSGDASYIKTVTSNSSDPSDLRQGTDRVIAIMSSFSNTGAQIKQLTMNGVGFSYTVPSGSFVVPAGYRPTDPTQTNVIYGISNVNLQMPYNRADYYITRPPTGSVFKVPSSCNPNTGILFKAVADHSNGFAAYPLLNCVGDMKVVFTMDWDSNGTISYFAATNPTVTALSAEGLRTRLKGVTVYILAQEGKKDSNYSYPVADPNKAIFVGPYSGTTAMESVGRMWKESDMAGQFGSDWKMYRWKVYTIPATLKNLQ